MTWAQIAVLGVPLLIALLGIGVAELKQYQKSADAQKHASLNYLAGLGVRIGTDAMALLRSNAALTPAGVLSWAINELQATAPDIIAGLGKDAQPKQIENLVRRSILASAQGGPADDVAKAAMTALAPTALTAKVSPNQIALIGPAPALALSPAIIAEIDRRVAAVQPRQAPLPQAATSMPLRLNDAPATQSGTIS